MPSISKYTEVRKEHGALVRTIAEFSLSIKNRRVWRRWNWILLTYYIGGSRWIDHVQIWRTLYTKVIHFVCRSRRCYNLHTVTVAVAVAVTVTWTASERRSLGLTRTMMISPCSCNHGYFRVDFPKLVVWYMYPCCTCSSLKKI